MKFITIFPKCQYLPYQLSTGLDREVPGGPGDQPHQAHPIHLLRYLLGRPNNTQKTKSTKRDMKSGYVNFITSQTDLLVNLEVKC